ncbi:hypothetical protein Ga0466249_000575 [Sporomusaceae bacterium BoRhaA]|uniref:hypothetical protein n=1 Tax=Pelorhabdus rhamnosifermentans TaxID=2772457 RepID=UPI001C060C2A|nr:hypothetical protein [Pelorhabdus rhamnosifermentans]MBU2699496.1 hypothetical protein [Pelorhabdus rhamnosifermentans]
MTNQEIAALTASIVVANTTGSGGNVPDNVCRITLAYREIYATIKDVDQCQQIKGQGQSGEYKNHRKIIEEQLELLIRTNELLFLQIANNPINSPSHGMILEALNRNVQTILSIVS